MKLFKNIYYFIVFILFVLAQSCKKDEGNDRNNINMPITSTSGRINSLTVEEPYGYSIAISADGNTAITGTYKTGDIKGGANIYVRNGNYWTLQATLIGSSLITDFRSQLGQGISVAISADGNTAIVGAEGDAIFGGGTAFIYIRTGTSWVQQTYITGISCDSKNQISITSDGNIAVIKNRLGYQNKLLIYKRTAGIWNITSSIMVDTTNTRNNPGSFAISGDGNIIALCKRKPRGGFSNYDYDGELDVYRKSGGSNWVKQASGLKPIPDSDGYYFGKSVSISDVGNIILVGTNGPNTNGGAYMFTSSLGTWIQSGNKLSNDIDPTKFKFIGGSVALSGDGYTAVIDGSLRFDANDSGLLLRKNVLFIYSLNSNSYKRQGDYIISNVNDPNENLDYVYGYSISVSHIGKTIIAGNSGGGKNGNKFGYIEFFDR